jgi:thiol-disulfide isomerase/thioredoxin
MNAFNFAIISHSKTLIEMSKITGLFCFLLFSQLVSAQGIEFFEGTWKEAIAEAQKEDKIVFVDSYAQWCGPCKKMAKNVFTQSEVGDFFNANFINLKLDMEQADGRTFGAKYPVSAYPTLFFLDSQGNILKKITGGQQAEALINYGELAIKSYDKSEAFEILYNEGKRDYKLMVDYVRELNKVDKPSAKISNEYLESNPDINKNEKAAFLMQAVTEADSKMYDQLIDLRSEAIATSSEEAYAEKINSATMKTVQKAVEYDYKDLVEEAIVQYEKAEIGDKKKFQSEAYLEYYALSGNYTEWKKLSQSYLKKYGKKDIESYPSHLQTIKTTFYHNEDATQYAIDIYKELIKKDDSTANYNEYIQFLAKAKQKEEAAKVIKEAIKKAKSRDEDITNLERMLDYINS